MPRGKETCGSAVCASGCVLTEYYQTYLTHRGKADEAMHWWSLVSQLSIAKGNGCPSYDEVERKLSADLD